MISTKAVLERNPRQKVVQIYPRFVIKKSKDLMIRGGDFYAIWLEDEGRWSTDEDDLIHLVDQELDQYFQKNKETIFKQYECDSIKVCHMWDADSGAIDRWHKYCQKQLRDNYKFLDEKLIFAEDKTRKEDYSSKRLPYSMGEAATPAYDKLINTLYSAEEKHKIEWAIGSIITGASKSLQKFLVLYGSAGTGKSTIINIIQQLFEGYYCIFDAKALGSSNSAFALEYFKDNPLVAIQHDGDLSRIEDNTRLNSLVSHEQMTVNEKHKSLYSQQFKCFLVMGTNKPVKITDAKSGLIRRLIDVTPSGKKLSIREYHSCTSKIKFELGGIAQHCKEVYEANPTFYDDYIPLNMLGATNDFYNFVSDSYFKLKEVDGITLKAAWELYKTYCDDAKVNYPYSKRVFQEELKNYFSSFEDRGYAKDGTRVRSYYSGFLTDKFDPTHDDEKDPIPDSGWIQFKKIPSIFDQTMKDSIAQYATDTGTPAYKWCNVKTKLSDLDTSKLHYVKVPKNHIIVDFDLVDSTGEKSLDKNIQEANQFPPTYAELSKSGQAVHLHHIYAGDVNELSAIYKENVEVKVYQGNSSLRRKLTLCNDIPIATIHSGLPKKEVKKSMLNEQTIKSEKKLRELIFRNLNKEIHNNTTQSVSFIKQILDDAYSSPLTYDVSDLFNPIFTFAAGSTHQADKCLAMVKEMHFKSKEETPADSYISKDDRIVFYDIEVFPNLLLVNWKYEGESEEVHRMINPSPEEVEQLLDKKLVGFNCRKYDNHILYARMMGYDNQSMYNLSQRIINGDQNAFFREAYNISYTDVYDFSAKKQSLKKFEIELGIHHKELGLPWDQPVDEKLWPEVAAYCDNDVLATEAVFNARKADFDGRKTLAKLANGTINDKTNTLTTKLIFGNNRNPQSEFVYTDLSTIFPGYDSGFDPGNPYRQRPSTYFGEETGEGGYVYAEPGMYENVTLLDITSMHPHSVIALNLFGDRYTKRFEELVEARVKVKHKDREALKTMMDGAFSEYADASDEELDGLAFALKIAINSVYGLTSAKFANAFKDPRNLDNIVAKRGALFMITLKHKLAEMGVKIAHIKVDSIKIPNATPEVVQYISDFGKQYGYTFEHEATYEKMCLINNTAYVARYSQDKEINGKHAGEWTATAKPFIIPYIFKPLFSHEPLKFEDMTETFSVTSALYLDLCEGLPNVEAEEKELKKIANDPSKQDRVQELQNIIFQGHHYAFVGKVGNFCPMLPGCGAGKLMREKNGKYDYASGSKGYLWMDSETVKKLGLEDKIDKSYFRKACDEVVEEMTQFGDFNTFTED